MLRPRLWVGVMISVMIDLGKGPYKMNQFFADKMLLFLANIIIVLLSSHSSSYVQAQVSFEKIQRSHKTHSSEKLELVRMCFSYCDAWHRKSGRIYVIMLWSDNLEQKGNTVMQKNIPNKRNSVQNLKLKWRKSQTQALNMSE